MCSTGTSNYSRRLRSKAVNRKAGVVSADSIVLRSGCSPFPISIVQRLYSDSLERQTSEEGQSGAVQGKVGY